MERPAGDLRLFRAAFSADVTALGQLFFDLHQIFFFQGNVQCGADGLQMIDLFFYLAGQLGQCFIGTL